MPDIIRLFLAIFANYRFARAVSEDAVTDGMRIWLGRQAGQAGRYSPWWYAAELAGCSYCAGFWSALLAGWLYRRRSRMGDALLLWWGLAGVQAFLEACND